MQAKINRSIMKIKWLIIDGHNLMHKHLEITGSLNNNHEKARADLIRFIEKVTPTVSKKVTVVFDGKKLGDDPFLSSKFVEVIYAPSKLTADGLIERLVTQHSSPESILVITSDHLEQQTVSSSGAQFQSAEDFLINNVNNNTNYSTKMRPSEKPKLGDFFP